MAELCWKGSSDPSLDIILEMDGFGSESREKLRYEYGLFLEGSFSSPVVQVKREYLVRKEKGQKKTIFDLERGVAKTISIRGLSGKFPSDQSLLEVINLLDFEGTMLRQFISGWRFYRLLPTPFMKQPNVAVEARYLQEFGQNLSAWLFTLQSRPSSYKRFQKVVADLFPDIQDIVMQPPQGVGGIRIAIQEHLLSRAPITLAQMSDGELACLALLSLLLAPKELGAPLYCVEEPENFLHRSLLETLTQIYRQYRSELGPDAAQLIITTHSLPLVDQVDIADLLLTCKENGATRIRRPARKKELSDLLSRKEISLGELLSSGSLED
ncbi:hypothetical protein MAMC_00989 [Methylacidimicrobium cyclopophantes]|uniref:ATPase AAA-type core domain-containing protein n=2 Tax=Methylacidimicrobium cyclopophantes TaxID=1041766 RepID=A0A5E6M9Y2_9BACT|nr:hypothetical protein MAMC_00989 [Methylacidimicrobium cyclopophantes]